MATRGLRRMGRRMRTGMLLAGLAAVLAGCAGGGAQTAAPVALTPPGAEISRFTAPEPLHALSWSSDGSLLAAVSASDTQVYVWNTATGVLQWQANRAAVAGAEIRSLAFTADGLAVVTPTAGVASDTPEAALTLLSVLHGRVMRTVSTRESPGAVNQATAFALDDGMAAVAMGGTRIGLFETGRWRLLRSLDPGLSAAGAPVSAVAMDRRRDRLALASGGQVQLWALSDGRRVAEFTAVSGGPVSALAVNPADGSLLTAGPLRATVGEPPRGEVRRWSAGGGSLLMTYATGLAGPQALAVSPDGQRVAAAAGKTAGAAKGYVLVWETASGAVVGGLVHDDPAPGTVAFSPDGGRLAYSVGADVVLLDLTRPPPPRAPEPPPVTVPPVPAPAGSVPAESPPGVVS